MWPSDRYGVEFQHTSHRYWLGTLRSADLAACVYDIAVWWLGLPPERLNFSEIDSLEAAELVGPKVTIVTRSTKPKPRNNKVAEESEVRKGASRICPVRAGVVLGEGRREEEGEEQ